MCTPPTTSWRRRSSSRCEDGPATTPEQAPIRGWLYGIATNLLRNHVRQEVRGFELTAKAGAGDRPAENHDSAVAGRVDAAARLRTLAPGQVESREGLLTGILGR